MVVSPDSFAMFSLSGCLSPGISKIIEADVDGCVDVVCLVDGRRVTRGGEWGGGGKVRRGGGAARGRWRYEKWASPSVAYHPPSTMMHDTTNTGV